MNYLITSFKKFLRCDGGMALVELAIAFPVMITLLIGMVEITNYVFAHNKAEKSASALANIIARDELTESQIDDLILAVNPLMEPFDFQGGSGNGVMVTGFGVDSSTGDPVVNWTRTYQSPGAGITPAQLASKITLDPARDETLIVVQVFYQFTPMMTSFLFSGDVIDIETMSLALPRYGAMKSLQAG